MAIQAIAQLKKWFRKGAYPTGAQFADMIDSFRHKHDKLSFVEVSGLTGALNGKYDSSEAQLLERRVSMVLQRVEFLEKVLTNGITYGSSFMSFVQGAVSMRPVEVLQSSCVDYIAVVWLPLNRVFAARSSAGLYYANWDTADAFMDAGRIAPRTDRFFQCGGDFYYWDGEALLPVVVSEHIPMHVSISKEQYDAMDAHDPDTIYLITEIDTEDDKG